MTDKPTRRDLMKPVQLLGLAFIAAVFAGIVTLVSMGFFQNRVAGQSGHALVVGAIVAGVTFIATLLVIALLVLAVDPAQVTKTVDRPVLLPKDAPDAAAAADAAAAPKASAAPEAAAAAASPAAAPAVPEAEAEPEPEAAPGSPAAPEAAPGSPASVEDPDAPSPDAPRA